MLLYIDACPRKESRTRLIADALLEKIKSNHCVQRLNLFEENLKPLDEEGLNKRTELLNNKKYEDSMFDYANQFAKADEIIIAAPFWDLSFPAMLKIYLENIYAIGIVSRYGSDGIPVGMCNAKKLYFVTTAGGPFNATFSFDYIEALVKNCFGISEVILVKADMLDVDGFDAGKRIQEVIENL